MIAVQQDGLRHRHVAVQLDGLRHRHVGVQLDDYDYDYEIILFRHKQSK